MIVSFKAVNRTDLFFINKSLSQQPCKIFVYFMVFTPLTGPTMWYMLIFKSTPHCEPNSKSSPTPELLEERGFIFNVLCNSQSLMGEDEMGTIRTLTAYYAFFLGLAYRGIGRYEEALRHTKRRFPSFQTLQWCSLAWPFAIQP